MQQKGGRKNKRKAYYKKAGKMCKRDEDLSSNIPHILEKIKGFLVTCDKEQERRCINELFNVLTEVNTR